MNKSVLLVYILVALSFPSFAVILKPGQFGFDIQHTKSGIRLTKSLHVHFDLDDISIKPAMLRLFSICKQYVTTYQENTRSETDNRDSTVTIGIKFRYKNGETETSSTALKFDDIKSIANYEFNENSNFDDAKLKILHRLAKEIIVNDYSKMKGKILPEEQVSTSGKVDSGR